MYLKAKMDVVINEMERWGWGIGECEDRWVYKDRWERKDECDGLECRYLWRNVRIIGDWKCLP